MTTKTEKQRSADIAMLLSVAGVAPVGQAYKTVSFEELSGFFDIHHDLVLLRGLEKEKAHPVHLLQVMETLMSSIVHSGVITFVRMMAYQHQPTTLDEALKEAATWVVEDRATVLPSMQDRLRRALSHHYGIKRGQQAQLKKVVGLS